MKKIFLFSILAISLMSFTQDTQVMTEEEGMTVINTTTLAQDVKGYVGTTPLKIYIKKGKIVKVKALRNKETPKYFALVKSDVLSKFEGMSTKKAVKAEVDAATGATLSSIAVIKNVQKGSEYYNKNK